MIDSKIVDGVRSAICAKSSRENEALQMDLLPFDEAGHALASPDAFEKKMRTVRHRLAPATRTVVDRVEPFARPSWNMRINGQRLDNLFREAANDLQREVV